MNTRNQHQTDKETVTDVTDKDDWLYQ